MAPTGDKHPTMKHCILRYGIALLMVTCLPACHSTRPDIAVASTPRIVAHRGGTADAPENTLEAIRQAIAHHADALWLTVQLSSDGIPVLYRPADLNALTNGRGAVASLTAAQLAALNAGWQFRDAQAGYPYRRNPVGIPTLRDALRSVPEQIPLILDMKALPAEPLAAAVAQVLTEEHAWSRVTLYSTDTSYQAAFARYPQAHLFEARDTNRQRLLDVLLANRCDPAPDPQAPAAFEWRRDLTVSESFTLGQANTKVAANMWTPSTMRCLRRSPEQWLLAISVNNADDYRAAACLGLDAVLADSPAALVPVRDAWARGSRHCPANAASTR